MKITVEFEFDPGEGRRLTDVIADLKAALDALSDISINGVVVTGGPDLDAKVVA